MSLRREIDQRPRETCGDMAAAADLRWREGDRLMVAQEYDGAVYLLGYAIEMWLKLAAFRRHAAGPLDHVVTLRRTVRAWMTRNAPGVRDEGGHSLLYWASYIQLRPTATPAHSRSLLRSFRWHVFAVAHQDWRVEMRYRPTRRGYDDAWRMWEASCWVWDHRLTL